MRIPRWLNRQSSRCVWRLALDISRIQTYLLVWVSVVINQSRITAFELSRIIAQSLELDIAVCKEVGRDSFFEFSPDDDAVYIASIPLRDIEEMEKRTPSTAVSYDILLAEARETAMTCSYCTDFRDCFLYGVFAILHEFGHLDAHRRLSLSDFMRLASERGRYVAQLKMKLQIAANFGHDEIDSRRDYELGYRSIPFEKLADDYAKKLMPRVLASLIAKD